MGKLLKVLLILFTLFSIFVLAGWANLKYRMVYSDKDYRFIIKDQRDWYSISPQEGVYYSVGTAKSQEGEVVSYFGVAPISKETQNNKKLDYDTFNQVCNDNFAVHGKSDLSNSEIVVNNLEGFICTFEGMPENATEMYIIKQYLLLSENDSPFDYILSISYPKNDPEEKEKVERIVNSFYAQ